MASDFDLELVATLWSIFERFSTSKYRMKAKVDFSSKTFLKKSQIPLLSVFLLLEPTVSCNDSNITNVCVCPKKTYELEKWDENLMTEFDLHCQERAKKALPDLFYNIGVVAACLIGVLVDSYQV